ncbi:MAG: bifunctional hydroxymethylpyrimidine kinase/phosphomethylpyrimidine kinase [Lachnospiraceae bacterium]|nr:bifunctional hydroxymethylpyrimidine kinase/phosphomethylpyrimidine kinase [Lachnospiraceae bacterium]
MKQLKAVLTIAGSDSSGGAGIQADIKTMIMNGVYAMSAITALTAQNTTGVSGVQNVTPEFLGQQMDAVCTDIRPEAVKIGMVPESRLIAVVAEKLEQYQLKNVVADPVMVATSGARLMDEEAVQTWKECLLPRAVLITPNVPEAEVLSGMEIHSREDMEQAAEVICREYSCAVLCKGGHSQDKADDVLCSSEGTVWFNGERIENPNTHGTGCTLSSAIAANLAKGMPLTKAVENAKAYLTGALSAMLDLGQGSGPLHHGYQLP